MQTYGSSVVPMIEANYEMFTVVEKTIADFFISNEKEPARNICVKRKIYIKLRILLYKCCRHPRDIAYSQWSYKS